MEIRGLNTKLTSPHPRCCFKLLIVILILFVLCIFARTEDVEVFFDDESTLNDVVSTLCACWAVWFYVFHSWKRELATWLLSFRHRLERRFLLGILL